LHWRNIINGLAKYSFTGAGQLSPCGLDQQNGFGGLLGSDIGDMGLEEMPATMQQITDN
jgi:hypothetical protein